MIISIIMVKSKHVVTDDKSKNKRIRKQKLNKELKKDDSNNNTSKLEEEDGDWLENNYQR